MKTPDANNSLPFRRAPDQPAIGGSRAKRVKYRHQKVKGGQKS